MRVQWRSVRKKASEREKKLRLVGRKEKGKKILERAPRVYGASLVRDIRSRPTVDLNLPTEIESVTRVKQSVSQERVNRKQQTGIL